MNIPNIKHFRLHSFEKDKEVHKHIRKLPDNVYENGDPNFVDERTKCDLPKKEKSFLSLLFE